jgi:tetratricopeptide (TPR) repeat protein
MADEKYEEAADQFGRAIALDPGLVVAHYNLGYVSMALKRYPEAVRGYEGCVGAIDRLNSSGAKEREALERARLDELHELQDSLTAVRTGKVKNMSPGPTVLRMEERIRVLEQLRFNDRGLTRTPAEVFLGLGSAYFRQNLLPEAERSYVRALKVNDQLGAAHNNLAVIFILTGRYRRPEPPSAAPSRPASPSTSASSRTSRPREDERDESLTATPACPRDSVTLHLAFERAGGWSANGLKPLGLGISDGAEHFWLDRACHVSTF